MGIYQILQTWYENAKVLIYIDSVQHAHYVISSHISNIV